ncbi:NAD-dependent succinate-semialdehyde dehydrogenase [Stappia indica]|uniref:NAD-dependent succinate-semialdehyde dehydrogenase n=1 Tax=Stappia indica TaxID=538381 RepID=UPI0008376A59|nr:NAD-dependent succinate-semialdehyde dehydrogenase [Stappia indica]
MTPAQFIAGTWRSTPGAPSTPVLNPADNTEIGRVPHASADEISEALDAARRGFALWRRVSAAERGAVLRRGAAALRRDAEEIARQMVREQGKPLSEARVEVAVSADILDWSAGEGERQYGRLIPPRDPRFRQSVLHEPVGVCVLIPSWNVPVLFVARKLGECLAAGCSAILVGHKQTPGAAVAVIRALIEGGLPAEAASLLFGSNAELVETLLRAPGIAKVSFTGGTQTGRTIGRLAADAVLKTTLELGGHAPTIVFDDVDVEATAEIVVRSKFRNAGQVCNSPTRLFVQRKVHDAFADALARRATALRLGDGLAPETEMGPLASRRQLARIEAMVEDARGCGARILCGGERLQGPGNFHQPTLLAELPDEARILREEPFGPVAALIAFDEPEEMMAAANALPYGLAGYCYTRSPARARFVEQGLSVGMLGINTPQISLPETPFGGVRQSGNGSEGGSEGVAAYMTTKYVSEFIA